MKQPKIQRENMLQGENVSAISDIPDTPTLLLTVPQAAQQMGLSPAMVYKLILTENLPIVKLGRSTRIVYASLAAWLKAREEPQHLP